MAFGIGVRWTSPQTCDEIVKYLEKIEQCP